MKKQDRTDDIALFAVSFLLALVIELLIII